MKYDIFISYKRRGTSSATATILYDLLTKKGYSVFYDRKEIRQGKFDEQLLEHILNAKDVIILLEHSSLASCFSDMKEAYKDDWFCIEIMHALQNRKRIIPILLDGYKMPDSKILPAEIAPLTKENALELDVAETEGFYQNELIGKDYLSSKPRNIFLSQSNGIGVADFLFYSDGDCDIFEFGNLIGTIDSNIDEEHPYSYPVKRSGEHKFRCLNNDTFEEVWITEEIETNTQKYINIKWSTCQNLWELTDEDIERQQDASVLFSWGVGFFAGTSKHECDIHRSFLCLDRSAKKWNSDARDYLIDNVKALLSKDIPNADRIPWYKAAADYGSDNAMELLGRSYDEGIDVPQNLNLALEYGKKALEIRLKKYGENNADVAMSYHNLGRVYRLLKKYKKCIEAYLKAISIRESVFGNGNVETANSYYNLSLVYCERLKLEKALEAGEKALQIRESLLGEDNKLTHSSYVVLGDICRRGKDFPSALAWYEKGMNAGSSRCIACIGKMYKYGQGVEVNLAKALDYYLKASEMGFSWAMVEVADMFLKGVGVEIDLEKARDWYSKAADLGNEYAMCSLGKMYMEGYGVEVDPDIAYSCFLKSSEKGDVAAMCLIGDLYRGKSLADSDGALAFEWYRKAAEADSPYAQSRLGDMYANGIYVKQDATMAFKMYMKAAKQGFDIAYSLIGDMYHNGIGIPQDYKKALEWYQKAVDNGHASSLVKLGLMYEEGHGVAQNYDQALILYKKAIQDDSKSVAFSDGCASIGDMYFRGLGVEQDYEEAYNWYVRSDSSYSLTKVGDMFFDGIGREVDYQQALEWYSLAAKKDSNYASLPMVKLGDMYQDGLLGEVNCEMAKEWYLKAAQKDDTSAMRRLGYLCSSAKNYPESYKWYRKSADLGDSISMLAIGRMYLRGEGFAEDPKMALDWFIKSAEDDNAYAAREIALYYSGKTGGEKNIEQSIKWHEKAYAMGNADSAYDLAELYREGDDVPINMTLAIQWFKKASEKDSIESEVMLGDIYCSGVGEVKQDVNEAIYWYTKAADRLKTPVKSALSYAMSKLGDCFLTSDLGVCDYQRSFSWYMKAAELGDSHAMLALGFIYNEGYLGTPDIKKAIEWWQKAAKLKCIDAVFALSTLYYDNPGIGGYKKALMWSKKCVEICESNPESHNNLGDAYNELAWSYCKLEQFTEAVEYAEKSINFYGGAYSRDTGNVLDTLGVAYQGVGRIEDARQTFEKSYKVYDLFGDEEGMKRAKDHLAEIDKIKKN